MFPDNNPEDLEKTTKMNEEPASKPPKKQSDWVTAPMPAAAKPKAQPQPSAQPVPPSAGATAPMPPAPSPAAQPVAPPPAYQAEVPPSASGGGFGSFLSNVGINDPNTQKWVLIGAIVLVVLCCLCVCLVFGLPVVSSFFSTSSY
jgi:hypothetical protein